ncbi:MAG: hypothetical protein AAF623_06780 [Planctomycetota bacterium]
MSTQIFGCPKCQKPFQVSQEMAGQVVQCPSCAQTVEIPSNAFAGLSPATDPIVFQCPFCTGKFGITSEMNGQQVACPHCQKVVQIQYQDPSADASAIQTSSSPPTPNSKVSEPPPVQPGELFAPGGKKEPTKKSRTDHGSKKSKWKTRESERARKLAEKSKSKPPTDLDPPGPPAAPPKKKKKAVTPISHHDKNQPVSQAKTKPDSKASAQAKKNVDKQPAKSMATSQVVTNQNPTNSKQVEPNTSPLVEPSAKLASNPEAKQNPAENRGTDVEVTPAADATVAVEPTPEDAPIQPVEENRYQAIAHLLPPTFDVLDPKNLNMQSGPEKFKIFLPDGNGGTAQLDKRVLRVEHDGEQISLVAMTPEQRKRRRLIQNVIMVLIAVVAMAITFLVLSW